MKVLQVNCVFNNNSSTGKLTYALHNFLLSKGDESIVCFGYGDGLNHNGEKKLCSDYYVKANHLRARMSGLMYGGCVYSTSKLLSIIKIEKPDIVHLQCINGFFINIYRLISWLKNNKVKTLLTLHADFMFTANCGHALDCTRWEQGCGRCPDLKKATESFFFDRTAGSWKKMKKAFEGFEKDLTIVSVSPWLMERAMRSPILIHMRHLCIYNGLDTSVFYHREMSDFAEQFMAKDKRNILCVFNRFTAKKGDFKGSDKVVELAKKLEGEDVRFIIVGKNISEVELPSNIRFAGNNISQDMLAQLYSQADVTMLTSKKETFSMITAESLCCGTPVVGFKSGAPERIAVEEYSTFVEQGDTEALRNAVLDIINRRFDPKEISKASVDVYSDKKMCGMYFELYKEIIGEGL